MKTPSKRLVAVAAAAAATALALTGCSGSSGESSDDGTVTITFANADPSATWQKVVDGFEKKNPKITVKQVNIPYAQYTSTINQRLNQASPSIDIFNVDTGTIVDFNNRGFLANLNDMKQDALDAALSPDMVKANVIDGKLLAIEPWTTSQFLFYNKDVLTKAGVTPPSSDPAKPWTWEQLADAAKKIKDAGVVKYPFVFDQYATYYQLQPLGVSAGGGNGEKDGKVTFTNDGWQRALTWYSKLFSEGLAPRGITNDKNGALWSSGKVGMIVAGPWGLTNSLKGKLNFGIAPEPYFEGGKPATSTDSWSTGIAAKSKHKDAAKKFLRYMTINPTGNTESAEVAGITPTNKEAYEAYAKKADASAGEASANFSTIMKYQLQHNAVHRPAMVGYSVFEPGADKMFSDIRNGADPMKAAKQATETIESQLKRLK